MIRSKNVSFCFRIQRIRSFLIQAQPFTMIHAKEHLHFNRILDFGRSRLIHYVQQYVQIQNVILVYVSAYLNRLSLLIVNEYPLSIRLVHQEYTQLPIRHVLPFLEIIQIFMVKKPFGSVSFSLNSHRGYILITRKSNAHMMEPVQLVK